MSSAEGDDGYMQYLPEFLRGEPGERRDSPSFLEKYVSIFETLISGDPDPAAPSPRVPPPERVIDGLHHLFNPRRTRPELLRELARWVALELPPLRPSATEVERLNWLSRARLLIERMPLFYPNRWLKRGLYEALDVFVVNRLRPRIVIDDGEVLSMIAPGAPIEERVFPVVDARTFAHPSGIRLPFLVHPTAIATGGTADAPHLIVCDLGLAEGDLNDRRAAVWRLGVNGEPLDFLDDHALSRPSPVNEDDFATPAPDGRLISPIAAVEVPADGPSQPTTLFVLDQGLSADETQDARLLTFKRAPDATRFTATSPSLSLPAVFPLDMVHDGRGTLCVLDRGSSFPTTAECKLLVIDAVAGALEAIISITGLKEPRALAISPRGAADPPLVLLLTDARRQTTVSAADRVQLHGDLLRLAFDPAAPPATLAAESLLHPDQNSPDLATDRVLIQPTGLAADPSTPGVVYVCDQGYKWSTGGGGADVRPLSEPAKIVQIDLRQDRPRPVPVTLPNQLGFPARLAALPAGLRRGGLLAVVDHGYSFLLSERRTDTRARPHHFTMQVLYSRDRLPSDPVEQAAARNALNDDIFERIEAERPAHTVWTRLRTD